MDQPTIKFKYIFDDDYEPEYINGVHGEINPCGELSMHFFMDRRPLPYELKQGLREDGTLNNEEMETSPSDPVVRRVVKAGVIMSPQTALSIYNWLKDRLVEMGVDNNDIR